MIRPVLTTQRQAGTNKTHQTSRCKWTSHVNSKPDWKQLRPNWKKSLKGQQREAKQNWQPTSKDHRPTRHDSWPPDSNRKYISPHLDTARSGWAVMGGGGGDIHSGRVAWCTGQSRTWWHNQGTGNSGSHARNESHKRQQGKEGKSGSKVYTDLLEACDRITSHLNTPAAIVQSPLQSSPAHDIEVAVLNIRLETVQTETPLVIHTQDIRKTPKDKTLQKDGFHLTDTAGQKIVEAINTATEDLIKPAELKVHKIKTDRDNAKFVIGKN